MSERVSPGILIDVSRMGEQVLISVAGRRYECADMNTAVAVVGTVLCGRPIPETVRVKQVNADEGT